MQGRRSWIKYSLGIVCPGELNMIVNRRLIVSAIFCALSLALVCVAQARTVSQKSTSQKVKKTASKTQTKTQVTGGARTIASKAKARQRSVKNARVLNRQSAKVLVTKKTLRPHTSKLDAVRANRLTRTHFNDHVATDSFSTLSLRSHSVLVIDQDTKEVLVDKNASEVLSIASLTKLMTALVVLEANSPLQEMIAITDADIDLLKNSSSRLSVGSVLSREELLHLALMSSENRAAHALGRSYPGGLSGFVDAMNRKARQLGMSQTRYVDPTGLSPQNSSTAKDLSLLVAYASQKPLIRGLSTSSQFEVDTGMRTLRYKNTNRLVENPDWNIGLQKTGYIAEAGRCLVMQARISGRQLIMVFLDSAGKLSRIADAERVKQWVELGRF
jgi:D-alanyl-D-alanine endopeptidase (penicillin-binding protein 7)